MNELQSAIEAAGLPEPDMSDPRIAVWRGPVYEIYSLPDGFSAEYDRPLGSMRISGGEKFKTAAEACAQVRSWLDEQ